MPTNTLIDVPGFMVGHATNPLAATGCTVIICPPHTVGGVDVRGGAPGTRETDLLQPQNHVAEVSAIVLSGGSAFGLASADGVVRYLEENGLGYQSGSGFLVPIVPAAILFDLGLGDSTVRPDAQMGYEAAQNATSDEVAQGTVGAGTGALCGAMNGAEFATKGGLGSASIEIADGLWVAAIVAVNAVGDILDEQGNIMAGLRDENGNYVGMLNALRQFAQNPPPIDPSENTVIGAIATNAKLTKSQVTKVAQMAHDGIARAINPAHTMFDGDTIFALASGEIPADTTLIGAFAAEAMAQAIRNGIRHATTLHEARAWNA
ncbi:MAG: P1 family peptidase [Phototrophicaceae bacterium]